MINTLMRKALPAVIIIVTAGICSCDKQSNETKLAPPYPLQGGRFGAGAAASEDGTVIAVSAANDGIAFIGGDGEDHAELLRSYIHVYSSTGGAWTLSETISSDGYPFFGQCLKMSADGRTLVAGSRGAVHVFKRSGTAWEKVGLFSYINEEYPGYTDINFGGDIAVSGDGILVVAGHPNGNGKKGVVFLYAWDPAARNWNGGNNISGGRPLEPAIQISVTASDGARGDGFGHVALSADASTLAVGAIGEWTETVNGETEWHYNGCRAYVFRRAGSTYVERDRLMYTSGTPLDRFGKTLALSADGNLLAVAAPNRTLVPGAAEPKNEQQGAVYVYRYNGSNWAETMLTASDATGQTRFGTALAMTGSGAGILVGAPGSIWQVPDHTYRESAYLYEYSGGAWKETIIRPSDPAMGNLFGCSVAITGDGTTKVVGASYAKKRIGLQNVPRVGKGYIYR